jgi:hypothetical protein
VLLSANVGFLAIQSIDRNGSPDRTFAQITSYISAMLSLVIYLVAQILKRHHRYYFHAQAEDGVSLSRVQNVSAVMLTADVSVAEVHRPSEPISNRDCLQPPHRVVSLEVSLLLPSYLCCPLICFCSHYTPPACSRSLPHLFTSSSPKQALRQGPHLVLSLASLSSPSACCSTSSAKAPSLMKPYFLNLGSCS